MSFEIFGVPVKGNISIRFTDKAGKSDGLEKTKESIPIQDGEDQRGLPLGVLERIEKGEIV
jgi:hypothetical protein